LKQTRQLHKDDECLENISKARIITPDEMQRDPKCVVHYNSTSRIELERLEIQRLIDNGKVRGVPEYEFGAGAGKRRRKLGSIYDD